MKSREYFTRSRGLQGIVDFRSLIPEKEDPFQNEIKSGKTIFDTLGLNRFFESQ